MGTVKSSFFAFFTVLENGLTVSDDPPAGPLLGGLRGDPFDRHACV
jgi:hypothetical protein